MTRLPTPILALVLALVAALGAGCGGSGDDATPSRATDEATEEPTGSPSGEDLGDIGGARDALDSVGLETKASALERALGDDDVDKVEVRGDTVHIYLKGGTFDPMMACMVTGSILSDGERAVMHLDGDETPCD